jgi:microcystin-dependent protein
MLKRLTALLAALFIVLPAYPADIPSDFGSWSSTAGSNQPQGTTNIGTGLDDNLRAIQAAVKALMEPLSAVAGTNTVTATMANLTAYYTGLQVTFLPANTNTGATTLNISSLGAKSIFLNGAALAGYELKKNTPVRVYYDGTQFNVVAGAHGGDGTPVGAIRDRAAATLPNGYLLCDGSAVSRTTYADLFAIIGTTWGAGDGSTTFNLPSLARKVTVGSGGSATATLSNTVGSTGGEETHTLTIAEMPSHSHTGVPALAGDNDRGTGASDFSLDSGSNSTGSTGGGGAHNVMQPSAVVYKIIKY